MKSRTLLSLCLLLTVGLLHAAENTPSTPDTPSPDKKQEVKKLDGTKLFGFIEITDDYTIRIKSDSGIKNIPIASLAEKDFRKYGLIKDRSTDGKLWSQRKDALEEQKSEDDEAKSKGQKSESSSDIEIRLADLAPLQPLISAYESLNPKKDSSEDKKDEKSKDPTKQAGTDSEKSSTLHMFSGPGSLNLPNVPFASSAAETVISPATSAASTLTGVVPSMPITPSAP